MLTIKNIDKIKDIEFSSEGKDWIVYGMEEQKFQYAIVFIPRDMSHRVWDISKSVSVYLSRETVGNLINTYRLSSGIGETLIGYDELYNNWNIILKVCDNDLIK